MLAAIAGGVIGTLVPGAAVGYGMSRGSDGLAVFGAAIVAAAVGALLGVVIAMAFVLRHAPASDRYVTIMTVLFLGPPLCALVAVSLGQTRIAGDLDTRHLFAVWLAVVLPGTALLGRLIARHRAR